MLRSGVVSLVCAAKKATSEPVCAVVSIGAEAGLRGSVFALGSARDWISAAARAASGMRRAALGS